MPIRNAKLREQYRASQNGCELAPLIRCCNGHGRGLQIHHILRGPDRHDILPNFLLVCEESHRWCHDKPIDSRIACWSVKASKREFDVATLKKAWKQCPIGWIEWKLSECTDQRFVTLAIELIELFTE